MSTDQITSRSITAKAQNAGARNAANKNEISSKAVNKKLKSGDGFSSNVRASTTEHPYLRYKAVEINAETKEAIFLIRVCTAREWVTARIEAAVLSSRQKAIERISSLDFVGSRDDIIAFIEDMASKRSAPRNIVTSVGGWLDGALVTRLGVFGPKSARLGKKFMFPDPGQKPRKHEHRGTIETYKASAAPLLSVSPELCFAYVTGLAAPLASYIGGRKSFAAFFCADSATGKTSAIAFCQGLYTYALSDEDLESFSDTGGYIGSNLHSFSGAATGFADIKSAREKGADLAYKLQTLWFNTSGQSIRRGLNQGSTKKAAGAPSHDDKRAQDIFNILLLSSEYPLDVVFAKGNLVFENGDRARVIEIPVAEPDEGGIFCRVPKPKREEYVAKIERHLSSEYGTIAPAWARFIAAQDRAELNAKVMKWETAFIRRLSDATPLVRRIGKNFALLAATAHIADEAGLLPIPLEHFLESLNIIFERSTSALSASATKQEAFMLKALSRVVSTKCLPLLQFGIAPDEDMDCSLGFKRIENDGRKRIYLIADKFVASFTKDNRALANTFIGRLKSEVNILRAKDGDTKTVLQAGLPKRRYLCFSLADALAWRKRLEEAQ
jgi:hypothetical protein